MSRISVLRGRWERLAKRERRMLAWMLAVLVLGGLWVLAIAPAMKTLRAVPAQLDVLEAQWQTMEKLAAQARAMQGRPSVSRDAALRTLEASLQQRMGTTAQLSTSGDRVSVTLKGASPEGLAQWLVQARTGARTVARQASLTRGANGWDGTLVLELPPA